MIHRKLSYYLALATVCALAAGCDTSTTKPTGVRRFHSVLTPVIEVQADMSVYLNQQHPKPGGGTYTVGDPLPDFERVIPLDSVGVVSFEIDGDDFTMDATFTNLPEANTVTDPRASYEVGSRVVGDFWDIWLLSDVPNVVTIQMGLLELDPTTPGTYTFHFDSRTHLDHSGQKITVNNINSLVGAWPRESLSLYDIQLIGMDIEANSGPEEPSGQHRLNDQAPLSSQIDWSRPDP